MSCNTGLKPALSERLFAAAQEISSLNHIDIGSDHAHLPRYLLETRKVRHVIVVEKHALPFARAKEALKGYNADLRFGDGLHVIKAGEGDSLSITGMGAQTIIKILAEPEKVPPSLVLQANDKPELLRTWALEHSYALKNETMVTGFWPYTILSLEKSKLADPSYDGLEPELALKFGPLLLKKGDPILYKTLNKQAKHYGKKLAKPWAQKRLELIQKALRYYD